MDYQDKAYRGDPSCANMAAKAENPLYELMRAYVQAKEAYDAACQSYHMVSHQKADAEKSLLALSEKVTQVVQQGIYDPTAPQPSIPNVVGNGQYQGGLSPRY